jgi:hypothetical protein
MTASDNTSCKGHSADGCTEYEQVGRYLLVEEIVERREDVDGILRQLEEAATNQRPIQQAEIEALLLEAERLEELAQLLQLAGTPDAQEVTV